MSNLSPQLNLALALEGRSKADLDNAPLLALAGQLATLPDPEIDARFAAALEARLMSEVLDEQAAPVQPVARPQLTVVPATPAKTKTEPVRRAPVVTLPRRRFVVRRTLAAAIAAALALGAVPGFAAMGSLPGSPFYGTKLRMERVQLALFGTPLEDGFTELRLAQRRVDEATQLDRIGADADLIEATLRQVEKHLAAAEKLVLANTTDRATLTALASAAKRAETQMRALAPSLASNAKPALAAAIGTTRQIQVAVAEALGTAVAPVSLVKAADWTPAVRDVAGAKPDVNAKASDGASQRSDAKERPAPSTDDDNATGGNGKNGTISEQCQNIGSANGIGELTAAASRLLCK